MDGLVHNVSDLDIKGFSLHPMSYEQLTLVSLYHEYNLFSNHNEVMLVA